MTRTKKFLIAGAAFGALSLAACGDNNTVEPAEVEVAEVETMDTVETTDDTMMDDTMMEDDMEMGETIVDLAADTPSLSTLVTAVTAADLGETLSGDGPFTVFAPTNDAFDKLPAGTLDTLTMTENKDQLSGILTYHVVPSEVMAADLTTAITDNGGTYEITTVNGGTLTATVVDGSVILTDAAGGTATVTGTDIDASNGVVHTIDTVLMPG